jgi:hypothetical protein
MVSGGFGFDGIGDQAAATHLTNHEQLAALKRDKAKAWPGTSSTCRAMDAAAVRADGPTLRRHDHSIAPGPRARRVRPDANAPEV